MKSVLFAGALLFSTQAMADEFSCASAAIDAFLKADWEQTLKIDPSASKTEKTGILPRHAVCPPMEQAGMLEHMDKFQLIPVDENIDAMLIDSHQCGGGNKHGQYFVIMKSGKCDLVRKPEIGDMAFIAENLYGTDNGVALQGLKWTDKDAHCCPSQKGTIDYDPRTGKYSFNLQKAMKK